MASMYFLHFMVSFSLTVAAFAVVNAFYVNTIQNTR
jgi:ABC-type antimicrobial peptide transport system permease subunit